MQKQTTVTIDQKTFATLDRLAKSNDVSKKEFLSCALEYFEKYGINPVQHESPAKEMQKLIKRCDQVIAFIRKQEQDILRPACAAISTTEARIERVLDKLATAGQVRDLQKAVSDQQQRQNYDARNLRSDILHWAEPPSRNGKRSCILASSLTQRRKAVFSTTLRHCTRSRDKSL